MRPVKQTIVGCVAILAFGLAVWPGCGTPFASSSNMALPSSHRQIGTLRISDFGKSKSVHMTRPEMEAKIGPPEEYDEVNRVAGYKINRVTERALVLENLIPNELQKVPDGYDIGLVQYDSNNRVINTDVINWITVKGAIQQWLRKQDAESKAH